MDAQDYFKEIDFDKEWEEEDWERFFDAQDRFVRRAAKGAAPARPARVADPALNFRRVLAAIGMDPDGPRPLEDVRGGPADPGLGFWEEGAPVDTVPVYRHALETAGRVARFLNSRFSSIRDKRYKSRAHKALQACVRHLEEGLPQAPALLSRGHSIGYGPDSIKGNIVCCRRALARADAAVGTFSRLPRRFLSREEYHGLFRDVLTLRNALLRWVSILREQFARRA